MQEAIDWAWFQASADAWGLRCSEILRSVDW